MTNAIRIRFTEVQRDHPNTSRNTPSKDIVVDLVRPGDIAVMKWDGLWIEGPFRPAPVQLAQYVAGTSEDPDDGWLVFDLDIDEADPRKLMRSEGLFSDVKIGVVAIGVES